MNKDKPQSDVGSSPPQCSPVVSREKLMAVEAELMKAAADFGRTWGIDQREHPRSYWLELHLDRWGALARCALAYAECFDAINSQTPNK
jgi:hypothetical protein